MEGTSINLLLIAVAITALFKMVVGYKRGMVKEIISLVSLVVLSIVAALVAYGVSNYNDGRFFNVAAAVILLSLLGIVHHLLGVVFFSAKLVVSLPVVHSLDKLLGIVFGLLEIVLFLWTLYAFIMMMDLGPIGPLVLSYTEDSPILLWIYQHNYLAYGIERVLDEFSFLPLSTLLG